MAQIHSPTTTTNSLRALRGKAAIAGVATYGCGEVPGADDMMLLARAAHAAVADAGLTAWPRTLDAPGVPNLSGAPVTDPARGE